MTFPSFKIVWVFPLLYPCIVFAQQEPPQPPAAQSAPASPRAPRVVRMARYPSLSPDGKTIAFTYCGDIWTVPAEGGQATRIVQHAAYDARPRWSPDGKSIAFVSNRHGNYDIFIVPAAGGDVKQVTYHTADDTIGDWSPDGTQILFCSSRASRASLLYTVTLKDGRLRRLTYDEVALQSPVCAPDGKAVAYARGSGTWWRKGYRGSANADVYTLSLTEKNAAPQRLTEFQGNDFWPMYAADGKTIYFVTDRDGTFNIWRMSSDGRKPRQVTHHQGEAVYYPAISFDRRRIVYECGFNLWTLCVGEKSPQPRPVHITAVVEDKPTKPETITLARGVAEFEVSPDGKWVAFAVRGEIFMVPSDRGGEAIRLTHCPARDDDFVWSPDSKKIAYVCEDGADQNLCVLEVETKESKRLTDTPGPERSPQFSPNGRWIAYLAGAAGNALHVMPAAGGSARRIAEGPFLGSVAWSPDSRWLAYTRRDAANTTDIWVVPEVGGTPGNITRHPGANLSPQWTADGTTIVYLARHVDSSTTRLSGGSEIWAVSLTKAAANRTAASSASSAPPAATSAHVASGGAAPPDVRIDFEGIQQRARRLTGNPRLPIGGFPLAPDGKTIFFPPGTDLYTVPTGGGTPNKVASGVSGTLRIRADGSTIYFSGGSGASGGGDMRGGIRQVTPQDGKVSPFSFTAKVDLDRAEERRQMFDEGWRLLRDNFYDEKMHGVDWDAVRQRYRSLVDECVAREDFYLLMQLMVGELNASHLGVGPVGAFDSNRSRPSGGTGYLGVSFDDDYSGAGVRVADVMPDGPADKAESRVRRGEYILAVNGKDVTLSESLFQTLKAGASVELLVNTVPVKDGARTVKMTSISRRQWSDLEYERWVNANRQTVEKLSGGRLAYLHIKSMDGQSLARFQRELLSDAYFKEGLVLDVRWNSGGRIHDELFAVLTQRVHAYETPRGGLKMTQPFSAFMRPMILLINQSSASDAEIFPNGFRANRLGKLAGVPTAGAVIGTANFTLLDGQTSFRVPRTGWTTLDGRNLENYGVPPDIYVENRPQDILQHRDRQLETAVKELLKQIDGSMVNG